MAAPWRGAVVAWPGGHRRAPRPRRTIRPGQRVRCWKAAVRGCHLGACRPRVPLDAVLGKDAGVKERLHQGEDALVSDPMSHPTHEGRVVDLVEACRDVTFKHPLIRAGREIVNLGDGVLRSALRAEAVAARLEVRLEDRFEYQLEAGLHAPDPATVGMPRRRSFPDAFGIIRSRTGSGLNLPALKSARSTARYLDAPKRSRRVGTAVHAGRAAPRCPGPDAMLQARRPDRRRG